MKSAKELILEFIEAWNCLDFTKVVEMCAENIVYHNIPMPVLQGKSAVAEFVKGMGDVREVDWKLINIAENGNVVLAERFNNFIIGEKSARFICPLF